MIRFSVVPPDASYVFLMTSSSLNQSYIEPAAAGSDTNVQEVLFFSGEEKNPLKTEHTLYIYTHLYTFIYIYIHLYTFIYIYIHLYTFIYIYIHLYTFIYIYIHLYTFIALTYYLVAFAALTFRTLSLVPEPGLQAISLSALGLHSLSISRISS